VVKGVIELIQIISLLLSYQIPLNGFFVPGTIRVTRNSKLSACNIDRDLSIELKPI